MTQPSSQDSVGVAPRERRKSGPRPSPRRSDSSASRRAAVIDLGTNNCRLLIAERLPDTPHADSRVYKARFRIIDSFSRIVRLGEGLGQKGVLDPVAVERTIAALKICAQKIKQSGAKQVRAVATQACRQASNGKDFLERVYAETGIELNTISPMQEVQLGVSSTLPLLKRRWPYALIFDVGGGSTEVSFLKFKKGRGFQLRDSLSVPLGVVSLAEDYEVGQVDLEKSSYDKMRQFVVSEFEKFAQKNDIGRLQLNRQIQTVGMSGTVTTVKALDLKLATYRRDLVDRTLFEMAHLSPIRDELILQGYKGLLSHGCIGKDRADLVLPGVAILEGLSNAFQFERLLVLDRGLREGLLHEIFNPPKGHRRPPSRRKTKTKARAAA